MATEAQPESFFDEPTVALVIGISQYQNKSAEGDEAKKKIIPNLKYGAKDAKDFADFLKSKVAHEESVYTLLNEEATARNIRESFSKLKRECKYAEPKRPLVLIFFSGHGFYEDEEHYLVPYDGERGALAGTALSNRNIEQLISDLDTTRLLVFLDACHSGATELAGAKGEAETYQLPTTLGEGEGRCLIASCRANQSSWEWEEKQNGIFTWHLLDLLKNGTEDIPDVYIDAEQLISNLRKRVKETARKLDREQEVDNNAAHLAGLRLGINWPRWRKKKLSDQGKLQFVDDFESWLSQKKEKSRYSIVQRLKKYVESEEQSPGFDAFYGVFENEFVRSESGYDETQLNDAFGLILSAYGEQRKPSKSAVAKTGSVPQTPLSPTDKDKFIGARSAPSPNPEKSSHLATPPAPEPVAQFTESSELKRQLKPEDQVYLLEGISGIPAYFREVRILGDGLSLPISEADFSKLIQRAGKIKGEAGDQYMDVIVQKFYERWSHAPEVQPQSSINVRLGG
jgi:Caspase domain